MIKPGDKIRLTKTEQALFRHNTGFQKIPDTVSAHNRILQSSADHYHQYAEEADTEEESAASSLMAKLIELDKA